MRNGFMSKNNNRIIYVLVSFIILVPAISIYSMPSFRIEQLLLVALTIYSLIKLLKGKELTIHCSLFPKLLIIFGLFIIISITNGHINGLSIIINDFYELYKVYLYTGIFLLIATFINSNKDKEKVLKVINICILLTCLVSLMQYFNLFDLNKYYVPIFAPTQYRTLIDGYKWPRVVGLSNNPNVYSVIVSVGILTSLGAFLKTKKKYNIIIMISCFLVLLMTRSRSGFIFFVVSSFVFIFLYLWNYVKKSSLSKKNKILFFIIVLSTICFLFIISFYLLPEELTFRLKRIFYLSSDTSWNARLNNWQEYIDYFSKYPLFGIGPSKSVEFSYYADNEWLLLLQRYGIFGTMYFICIFAIPIIRYWNRLKRCIFGQLYVAILIGLIFYMIPAIVYHSFQLMPLIMVIAALAFSKEENLRRFELKHLVKGGCKVVYDIVEVLFIRWRKKMGH